MQRIIVIIGILVMVSAPFAAIAGWGDFLNSAERLDNIIVNRPGPSEQAEPSDEPPPRYNESRPAAPRGNEDSHFIQSDDYFISKEELGGHTYIYVNLAKMTSPPSSGSKYEGEFMKVSDGQNLWTSHIWQSRIATSSELRLGSHVIAFNDNSRNSIYQAPDKKDRARGGAWFYAKITDMSDTYKGFVTVSGNYKVGLNNLRIPIPYGSVGR